MRLRKQIWMFLIFAGAATASAQDMHFSQYYSSPLTINPALTGSFNGDYRAGLNYRSQWATVSVPYRTFDLFGDISFGRAVFQQDFYSFGLNIISDRAGDGDLSVTKLMGSGAFHFILDPASHSDLSIGIQGGWVQKKIDFTKLYFDNQWNEGSFDTQLPTGENFKNANTGYPDASAGIFYAYNGSRRISLNAGFAMYHLLKPKDSFYGMDNELGLRPVATAGISYQLSDALSISPSVYYQEQKKAHELLSGAMMKYYLPGENAAGVNLYAGLYGRFGDAFIPVAGFEVKHWRFLMNYDVNTSELKPASHGHGAFELSLIYIGNWKKNENIRIDLPCPRF